MKRPRCLDLFCGAGGAAMGLWRAGFDVVGVDIKPQKRYPLPFVQGDALRPPFRLEDFDLVWASPPCQHYTALRAVNPGLKTWHSIPPTRAMLRSARLSVIENVVGAPIRADVKLCGEMFGLQTYRHRLFEVHGFHVLQQPHPRHRVPHCTKKRRHSFDSGLFISVTGNVGNYLGPRCLGIDWMNGDELSQSDGRGPAMNAGRACEQTRGRRNGGRKP